MPRAGLTPAVVVELALAEVDEGGARGFEGLSLAGVAQRAGVATPSLYKHVGSLAELRHEVAVVAVQDLTRDLAAATVDRAGEDAVRALAHGVRAYAEATPGRYAATQHAATDPAQPGAAALAAAGAETVAVVTAALRAYDLPVDRLVDAVRAFRSAVHGFVVLEAGDGFGMPDDVDRSFGALVEMVVSGIAALASR